MILGFKTHFPDGSPTNFPNKIISGTKIHTIRAGERWRAGDKIHMATGVRTAKYFQFNSIYPRLQTVISIQRIKIIPDIREIWVNFFKLNSEEVARLIKNDGFDNEEQFWQWFGDDPFLGQLIHWTKHYY